MQYPPLPTIDEVADQFAHALHHAERADWPYRHWKLNDVFPRDLCTGILTLPIAAPMLGKTDGTRDSYNACRCFITPDLRKKFPTCQVLAEALQRSAIARLMAEVCGIAVDGGYLRMEYIQDTDGAWLEPHRDVREKLFSMVVYLFTGPDSAEWGTDVYDAERRWVGRSAGEFDSAVIFISGPDTWHGFEPRKIIGVRRLMEINYVSSTWRDREQLAFPDRPIVLA